MLTITVVTMLVLKATAWTYKRLGKPVPEKVQIPLDYTTDVARTTWYRFFPRKEP